MQVFCGSCAIPLNCIGNLQVASSLVIRGAQHTHRRQERPPRCAFPVEASQKKDGPVGGPLDSRGSRLNARRGSQAKGDGLPKNRLNAVTVVRKLCNRQLPISIPHGGFGTRSAQR